MMGAFRDLRAESDLFDITLCSSEPSGEFREFKGAPCHSISVFDILQENVSTARSATNTNPKSIHLPERSNP